MASGAEDIPAREETQCAVVGVTFDLRLRLDDSGRLASRRRDPRALNLVHYYVCTAAKVYTCSALSSEHNRAKREDFRNELCKDLQ